MVARSATRFLAGLGPLFVVWVGCGPADRTLVQAGAAGSGGDAAACLPPVAGPCDNFPQCGCASSQNCDFVSDAGETSCVAAGPKGPYSACGGVGECQIGSTCLKNDPGAASGICRPFCESNQDCPGDGRLCQTSFGTKSMKYCTLQCDLADPSVSCGVGLGCGLLAGNEHTDCVVPGSGKGGYACPNSLPTDCAPGYFCSPPHCVKWCRISLGSADCASGQQCQNPPDPVQVLGVAYGGCVPFS